MTKQLPVPTGRHYTDTEIAAARRLGYAHTRKLFNEQFEVISELGGMIVYAGGPGLPNEIRERITQTRRELEDLQVLLPAVVREWEKMGSNHD